MREMPQMRQDRPRGILARTGSFSWVDQRQPGQTRGITEICAWSAKNQAHHQAVAQTQVIAAFATFVRTNPLSMCDARARFVHATITARPHTPREINVLAVHKKSFIKNSGTL